MLVIPKSFKEVMVKDYIYLRPILERTYDNPFTRVIDILSVFNDREKVLTKKPREISLIEKELEYLFQEPSGELKQYFDINGKSYGVVNHINDLEAGQYISVVTLLKDLADNPNLSYELLHEILSCVVFPVDKDKNVLEFKANYFRELSEDIYNHMSIEEAYPLCIFFCNLSDSLIKCTQDYLNQKLEEMTMTAEQLQSEVMKDLEKDGVGL